MNCEKNYNRIFDVLVKYKDFVNTQEHECKVRKGYINKTYQEMVDSRKYTQDYLKEYKAKTKPRTDDLNAKIQEERKKAKSVVSRELGKIKHEMDSYFNAPLNQELANKINSITITGLKLSNTEFDLLKNQAKSYMDLRLLNQLAESRTKTEQKGVITDPNNINMDNNLHYEKVENPNPYYIDLPNIDICYSELKQFENRAMYCLDYYIGAECLNDMVECSERDKYGQLPKVYINASADTIFKANANDSFINMLNGLNIKDFSVNQELTEDETAIIDGLINPNYPMLAKDKVKEVYAMGNSYINGLLENDNRYSKIVANID